MSCAVYYCICVCISRSVKKLCNRRVNNLRFNLEYFSLSFPFMIIHKKEDKNRFFSFLYGNENQWLSLVKNDFKKRDFKRNICKLLQ